MATKALLGITRAILLANYYMRPCARKAKFLRNKMYLVFMIRQPHADREVCPFRLPGGMNIT